jgi:chromate transporter
VPAVGAAFYGVNPAVIAVMVATGWRMAKSAVKDRFGIALAVLSLALILARAPIALVLLGAGLIGYLRYAPRRTTSGRAAAVFPVLAGTGLGKLAALGWVFLRAGAMLYGGGFVIVAFIEQDVVRAHGWLTRAEFLDGVAIGQVTPGPVLTTATFVGYRVGGVLGAAVATVAVFLPSFVYILAAAPNLDRWRANPSFQAFLKGANPAVVGALFAAAWLLGYGPGRHPVAAVHGLPTALIFAASLVALLRTKVAVPWVLAGAALAGIAARSI